MRSWGLQRSAPPGQGRPPDEAPRLQGRRGSSASPWPSATTKVAQLRQRPHDSASRQGLLRGWASWDRQRSLSPSLVTGGQTEKSGEGREEAEGHFPLGRSNRSRSVRNQLGCGQVDIEGRVAAYEDLCEAAHVRNQFRGGRVDIEGRVDVLGIRCRSAGRPKPCHERRGSAGVEHARGDGLRALVGVRPGVLRRRSAAATGPRSPGPRTRPGLPARRPPRCEIQARPPRKPCDSRPERGTTAPRTLAHFSLQSAVRRRHRLRKHGDSRGRRHGWKTLRPALAERSIPAAPQRSEQDDVACRQEQRS